ncbi:MAG TPA: DsbA family protein [Actinocrinis sp.]|nr:DsbA family protein [Actinocrinis sp.]
MRTHPAGQRTYRQLGSGARIRTNSDAYLEAVRTDEREARQLGANGVPFFVIDRRHGVPGAQSADALGQALRTAFADRPPVVTALVSLAGEDAAVCGPEGVCEVPGATPGTADDIR